jgi:transposase
MEGKGGIVDRLNRCGEVFKCIGCGFTADADYVGAVNILRSFLSPTIPEETTVLLHVKDNFMDTLNKMSIKLSTMR